MFRSKTVFVVGAGASAELDLPLGAKLLNQISKLTHLSFDYARLSTGDAMIFDALKTVFGDENDGAQLRECIELSWQISRSSKQAISIDNLIDALENEKIDLIGKLGIARAILDAENRSRFFKIDKATNNFVSITNFRETWLSTFSKMLTENIRISNIDEIFSNISIINFNYDRCIENFLPYSISDYYGIPLSDARNTVDNLEILRPYGSVGALPWQNSDIKKIDFGKCNTEHLLESSKIIKTFTETTENNTSINLITNLLQGAEKIVFLGFAFHPQNLELLKSKVSESSQIFGTSLGLSEMDKSSIKNDLRRNFDIDDSLQSRRISLLDMRCSQFFETCARTLTSEGNAFLDFR